MANRLWAGLDVGVETTSVCVIDDAGVHEAKCTSDLRSVVRELAMLRRRRSAIPILLTAARMKARRVGIATSSGGPNTRE